MVIIPRPQGQPCNQVYVVHVGDSRIYWVSPQNCRQVTLDDDVATRESVLGYNFYVYSHQRVDGGALIQALGTRASDSLVPRIQRLQLDEDCLLMLCSDGLSDFERVNELCESHIQPILTKNLPLYQACQTLIAEANSRNGHDNVTIALMRCRLAPPDPNEDIELDSASNDAPTLIPTVPTEIPSVPTEIPTVPTGIPTVPTEIPTVPTEIPTPPIDLLVENNREVENSEDNEDSIENLYEINGDRVGLEETDEDTTDLKSDASQQTSRGLVISLVIVMFLLGCGITAALTPAGQNWMRDLREQIFPGNK
jgi:protein phosphatase